MLTCQVRGGGGVGSWQSSSAAEAAGTRISDQRYKSGKQIFVPVRGLSEFEDSQLRVFNGSTHTPPSRLMSVIYI